MSNNVVLARDFEGSELAVRMKNDNPGFYSRFLNHMNKMPAVGIRQDIIECCAQKSNRIPEDVAIENCLCNVAFHASMTGEYMAFALDYYAEGQLDQKLGPDDFNVVFPCYVEKAIPMIEIRRVFKPGNELTELLQNLDFFMRNHVSSMEDSQNTVEEEQDTASAEIQVEVASDPVPEKEEEPPKSNDVEMFNNIVDIMTLYDKDGDAGIAKAQAAFNGLVQKLQGISSELSIHTTDMLKRMEDDKKEIKRLNSVVQLMQKLLSAKQLEISELRGEVASLNERIRNSERAELRRNVLNQKIDEMYRLASMDGDYSGDNILSFDGDKRL